VEKKNKQENHKQIDVVGRQLSIEGHTSKKSTHNCSKVCGLRIVSFFVSTRDLDTIFQPVQEQFPPKITKATATKANLFFFSLLPFSTTDFSFILLDESVRMPFGPYFQSGIICCSSTVHCCVGTVRSTVHGLWTRDRP